MHIALMRAVVSTRQRVVLGVALRVACARLWCLVFGEFSEQLVD